MRLALPAILLAASVALLVWASGAAVRSARETLRRSVEAGPMAGGLVPRLAFLGLILLTAAGGYARLMLP